MTPERAEYLNRRKRGHSAKVDSETSNSLGEQQEKEQDGVNEENHENENPVMDEAKPCGPMRIQRKRRLTELSDFRANKRHKTSGGGTCEWVSTIKYMIFRCFLTFPVLQFRFNVVDDQTDWSFDGFGASYKVMSVSADTVHIL